MRQVQDCPIYAGMIEAMDDAVGLVMDTLDRLGLSENTIVCFTSDNGGVSSGDAFSASMLPLRGGKGRQWEGGIREPVYLRYPKFVEAGSISDTPVSGIDFYPTFAELAGINIPQSQIIDGKSMVKLLNGNCDHEMSDRDLFWHYPHYGNQGGDPSSAIRSGDWKLIHYYEDGRDELYNLKSDQGELNDIAETNVNKVVELRSRLDKWLDETNAKFPVADPQYDPEKENEYLKSIERDLMPKLESEHAEYLNANWVPNADWWGSQVVVD